ncbi:MAG: type II toxin-antitoxin system VapC family toxin [Terriglobales bacterium]
MRIALDTNRYVDFAKGDKFALETVQRANEIVLPFVVLGELRAGFVSGSRSSANEQNLVRFLNSPRVSILFPDDSTTHHYAQLFLQLRKQGTPIPTNDIWIASLVVQHKLILFARDKHFENLRQIPTL